MVGFLIGLPLGAGLLYAYQQGWLQRAYAAIKAKLSKSPPPAVG